MRQLISALRPVRLVLAFVFLSLFSASGMAQDAPESVSEWQAVITDQIEAFRRGDAESALEFAGTAFRVRYADADRFYSDIKRSGYGPILESRSHTFGDFRQIDETSALQIVNLIGPERGLYQALYQLGAEDDGWRIQGVVLRRKAGVSI